MALLPKMSPSLPALALPPPAAPSARQACANTPPPPPGSPRRLQLSEPVEATAPREL